MRVKIPEIHIVQVDKQSITPEQDKMPTEETQLDVQVVGSICPDAKITVYRAPNPMGFSTAVERAVDDKHSVISISWGGPETFLDAYSDMERVLKKAKDKGVTVCVATGDSGASDGISDGKAHADYPASSQYVLACGGTEILLNRRKVKEVVWNNGSTDGGATGGGVSELFDKPSWQSELTIPSVNTGKAGRIIPDVAGLAASGDYNIFEADEEILIGGTSAVAPLWASFITLVNEARAENNKQPLGFVNERFYQLAAKKGFFNPVTEGDNKRSPDQPGYQAKDKFNACCGWGSPNGSRLFEALLE